MERMNSKVEQHGSASAGDFLKYALALLLVGGGVFAFYWFADWATALRALVVVAGLVAGIGVFLTSAKGRQTLEFLSESRFELRKVVWPTRQETTRMTWVVIAVVVILSLILAGFDFFVQKAIQWFLGR
jgi:preprotein translocase subunit SecE